MESITSRTLARFRCRLRVEGMTLSGYEGLGLGVKGLNRCMEVGGYLGEEVVEVRSAA